MFLLGESEARAEITNDLLRINYLNSNNLELWVSPFLV
jgi:hypothetical protein